MQRTLITIALLFLPDMLETFDLWRSNGEDDVLKRNLPHMKQLLLDESIPDHRDLHVIDYQSHVVIADVGRLWLVKTGRRIEVPAGT